MTILTRSVWASGLLPTPSFPRRLLRPLARPIPSPSSGFPDTARPG